MDALAQKKDKKSEKQGCFIVFEGSDGTGKSTQLALLQEKLCTLGYPVLATREPSDGTIGRKIRNLFYNRQSISPQEELQLFLDDRRDHLQKTILPALTEDKIVLCDRYFLSTVAYQSSAAGFSTEELLAMNAFAPLPDIALLLHAPLEICLQRIIKERGGEPNDFERQEYLEKVINNFEGLRFYWLHRIDAGGSKEETFEKVVAAVQKILPPLPVKSPLQ